MSRALLINPNTSTWVTRLLAERVGAALGPDVELVAATARFGASYIASETAYTVAAHAVLDAYACHGAGCHAVLVGCFGDPGVDALRELCGVPVTGLAEASMREAASSGRFAIVTGGAAWRPMLARLAVSLGLQAVLERIVIVERSGAQLAADPLAARGWLGEACRSAAAGGRVGSVILGGAALAGMAADIAAGVDVPVIDSVDAGARALAASLAGPASGPGPRDGARYEGLSAELTALLRGPLPS